MKNNILIVCVVALSITSCYRFTRYDTYKITNGMLKSRVVDTIGIDPDKELLIDVSADPNSRYEVLNFTVSAIGTEGIYLLAFKNDSLYYWGYPYEFNRHPSPILNEIGKAAYKKIKDE